MHAWKSTAYIQTYVQKSCVAEKTDVIDVVIG